MTEYREKSRIRRIITWKRLLLLACFSAALYMIIRTPIDQQELEDRRLAAAPNEWDATTVNLFKKQLGVQDRMENRLPGALRNKTDPTNCRDFSDEDQDYLIITGFPGPENTFQSHLWLFFNLLALEKIDRPPSLTIRLLLPRSSHQILKHLFQDIQFDDLSSVLNCNTNLNVQELLKFSRIIGNQDKVQFDLTRSEKVQLVILNENTRRLKDLSELDFSFIPYRPSFRTEVLKNVQEIVMKAADVSLMDSSSKEEDADAVVEDIPTIRHTFVGVYLGEDDKVRGSGALILCHKLLIDFVFQLLHLWHQFKMALEYHRTLEPTVIFIVLCHEAQRTECQEKFKGDDTFLADSQITIETRFAMLSSCHSNIISNDLGFLAALMNNGEASLLNFVLLKSKGSGKLTWPLWFAEKRPDWTVFRGEERMISGSEGY